MNRIIDFHTHAFPDPLAARAISALEANSGESAETGGRVDELLALMDRNGVARCVVQSIATRPVQFQPILEWSLRIRTERVIPFASVHPSAPDFAAQVEQIRQAGLHGIKLHPHYQDFLVDEERVFPLYEAIEKSGLLLLMHAGYDIAFGDMDNAIPERFVPVLDAFPRLRLVMAHFGGWKLSDQFLERIAGRDVCIDTSFMRGYCTDEQCRAILERHGADRILFGSDSPWGRMHEQIQFVRDLSVSDADKEKVLHGNAERLLAHSPAGAGETGAWAQG